LFVNAAGGASPGGRELRYRRSRMIKKGKKRKIKKEIRERMKQRKRKDKTHTFPLIFSLTETRAPEKLGTVLLSGI
jgi:hypothetical protein